jgi:hypothetical protein
VLTLVNPAAAQSRGVELGWSAPASCPNAAEVARRAERILNRPLARPGDSEQLKVSAVVTAPSESSPWSVTLETGSASRTVQAASCDELVSATAVFLAILLEPNADEAAPEPTSQPEPPPPAPALPPAAPPAAAQSTSSTHLALGSALGMRSGLVPDLAAGLELHATLSWQLLRFSAGASYWLPDSATLDDAADQGARIQVSSAFGELCLQYQATWLVPCFCSGGEISVLRGEGFGPGVAAESRSASLVSLTAGGALRLRQSEGVSWLLDADAVLPLGERNFVFAGSAPALIHTPGAGFRLTIGAEWSL